MIQTPTAATAPSASATRLLLNVTGPGHHVFETNTQQAVIGKDSKATQWQGPATSQIALMTRSNNSGDRFPASVDSHTAGYTSDRLSSPTRAPNGYSGVPVA